MLFIKFKPRFGIPVLDGSQAPPPKTHTLIEDVLLVFRLPLAQTSLAGKSKHIEQVMLLPPQPSFNLHLDYSNSLTLSNVGELS